MSSNDDTGSDHSEVVGDITRLLHDASVGADEARDALFQALFEELRQQARALMARQSASHTLQATALVNEVYLRLFRGTGGRWESRRHFLLSASRAMRHLLVDHARRGVAAKRDGIRVPLEDHLELDEFESVSISVEALDVALEKLAKLKPEMARAVELRFFGNVSQEEIARILGVSHRSFQREWALARTWIYAELA